MKRLSSLDFLIIRPASCPSCPRTGDRGSINFATPKPSTRCASFAPGCGRCRVEAENIGLDAILYSRDLGGGNVPVAHQMVGEGRCDDDDALGAAIKKSGDCTQRAMEQTAFAARADGRQRFRPEIADFKNKGDALPPSQPPSRKGAQQLRRSGDDHVGLGQSQPADRCRDAEGRVIADSFVRLSVGKRPEPGTNDFHAIDGVGAVKAMQSRSPLLGYDSGGMIRKSGEDGDIMSHARPMARQFRDARSRRSHFRRKILRDVENFHDTYSGAISNAVV